MTDTLLGMRVWLLAGAAAVLAIGLAPAGADVQPAKPFSAYPSCGAKGKHGDRFCFEGDHPVAVFRAFGRRQVAYRLCTRKRGSRQRCNDRRTNNPGQRSRTRFDVDGAGKYKLAWFEGGKAVDRDSLVVRERSVFSIGDSLGEGTRPYLPGALRRWRVEPVGLDFAPCAGGRLDPAPARWPAGGDRLRPRHQRLAGRREHLPQRDRGDVADRRADALRRRPQHPPPAGRRDELLGL